MSTTPNPYRGFRFPAEIINQAVWLYHCFSLSLRDVELILAARDVVVSLLASVAGCCGPTIAHLGTNGPGDPAPAPVRAS